MDRLSIFLTLVTGAVITGGLVTLALSLGWVAWGPILGAVAVGWLLAWPVAWWISRRIKKNDAAFDHTRVPQGTVIPDPDAPEV